LAFYRVHIPCKFVKLPQQRMPYEKITISDTLYFNPEYDFLKIRSEYFIQDTLIDFLYRLKTVFDPRHIGLLKASSRPQRLERLERLLEIAAFRSRFFTQNGFYRHLCSITRSLLCDHHRTRSSHSRLGQRFLQRIDTQPFSTKRTIDPGF